MLTVSLGLEGSGNNSTRNPLGKVYSVMPSTEAPFWTPGGNTWENREAATVRAISGIRNIFWSIGGLLSSVGDGNYFEYSSQLCLPLERQSQRFEIFLCLAGS